jgi:hypothetical protein
MPATATEPLFDLDSEITRYLAVVQALREEGLEPKWMAERGDDEPAEPLEPSRVLRYS